MMAGSMEAQSPQGKRAILAELLEQGMVLVTVDARHQDVDVPPHLRQDAQLRLKLSYRFGLPLLMTSQLTSSLSAARSSGRL